MKTKSMVLAVVAILTSFFYACKEDRDYLLGMPEYDHHYYISYVPYNNTQVTVSKNKPDLLAMPLSFHSSFTRSYDAVAKYKLTPATGATATGTTPAIIGTDFNIVKKDGTVITPVDGIYSVTFPQAKRARDTIYIKLLNNPAPGSKSINIDLIENVTQEYRVDTMSASFRRPIRIN
jgi:hypothetical protein